MRNDIISNGGKTVIGMVHCKPLPTTVGFNGDYQEIIDIAVEDAKTLEKAGVDGIIVENMGDTPFSALLNKAQLAALSVAAYAVKEAVKIPVGVDAAFNDCESGFAIAGMIGADFVRVPVFVDRVLFTDGVIEPCAKKCMEYRKSLGLEHIKILADIQVKSAKDAAANGADAIIVTGSQVGEETPIEMIDRVKKVVNIPVIAGSGVNDTNIKDQLNIADGAIIGSGFKVNGKIENPISYELTKKVMDALRM